ncbi:MAG TPA: hypothetical protein VGD56_08305, partial [Gemmatirosa sp.]
MTRIVECTLLALLASVSAPRRVLAQRAALSLEHLATAWSGGATAPTCQDSPGEADLPAGLRCAKC